MRSGGRSRYVYNELGQMGAMLFGSIIHYLLTEVSKMIYASGISLNVMFLQVFARVLFGFSGNAII
jgi:hypothetical protein